MESTDGKGAIHGNRIPAPAVEYLQAALEGRLVGVEEAASALELVAKQLNLSYTYGYKLNFYAQQVLLVLVALGKANVSKEGRGYQYRVSH